MPHDEGGQPEGRWPADLASAAMALARRFPAGGSLWCWAPRWPQHAEHIAVEFVHPVIMGKRALPAAAVDDSDPVGALRTLTEPGDVLLVVADDSSVEVNDVLRRAPAWGVETILIGCGPRPHSVRADHLVWRHDVGQEGVFSGALVFTYHVLWELTHVCFEHPGLLATPGPEDGCGEDRCVTCADEGRLGEVFEPAGPSTVLVRTAAGTEGVDTTLVEPVVSGDLVLIHAGVAISRVEEERA